MIDSLQGSSGMPQETANRINGLYDSQRVVKKLAMSVSSAFRKTAASTVVIKEEKKLPPTAPPSPTLSTLSFVSVVSEKTDETDSQGPQRTWEMRNGRRVPIQVLRELDLNEAVKEKKLNPNALPFVFKSSGLN